MDFSSSSSAPVITVKRVNDGKIVSLLSKQIDISGTYESSYVRIMLRQRYYSSVNSILIDVDIIQYKNGERGSIDTVTIWPSDIGNTEEFYFKCTGSNATTSGELKIEGYIGVNENYPTLEVDNSIQ